MRELSWLRESLVPREASGSERRGDPAAPSRAGEEMARLEDVVLVVQEGAVVVCDVNRSAPPRRQKRRPGGRGEPMRYPDHDDRRESPNADGPRGQQAPEDPEQIVQRPYGSSAEAAEHGFGIYLFHDWAGDADALREVSG